MALGWRIPNVVMTSKTSDLSSIDLGPGATDARRFFVTSQFICVWESAECLSRTSATWERRCDLGV